VPPTPHPVRSAPLAGGPIANRKKTRR